MSAVFIETVRLFAIYKYNIKSHTPSLCSSPLFKKCVSRSFPPVLSSTSWDINTEFSKTINPLFECKEKSETNFFDYFLLGMHKMIY